MGQQHHQTLQALEAFIQTQKDLLARQRADIDRLQQLKVDLVENTPEFLAGLDNEADKSVFRLSEQTDCRLRPPSDIDWKLFQNADPTPFRTLAAQSRERHACRNRPHTTQQSELSDLQKLVKRARLSIVDPVLARVQQLPIMQEPDSELESESEAAVVDPIERKRQQEREKIRLLRMRKIRGSGLSLPASSLAGNIGVFIRNDVEDETMEVDIGVNDDDGDGAHAAATLGAETVPSVSASAAKHTHPHPATNGATTGISTGSGKMAFSSAVSGGIPSSTPVPNQPRIIGPATSGRTRKPTVKVLTSASFADERPRKKTKTRTPLVPASANDAPFHHRNGHGHEDDELNSEEEGRLVKPATAKKNKPKPETYKQAWSMSEQNLLEQLLEQIPDGEKNRWQQISKAMGGRRTPRQVASRVQKYFEKLKKFGVGIVVD